MANLQGHRNTSRDISDRIYRSIMNASTGQRPRCNRPSSTKSTTSTQLSFPASPRHSARSKVSQSSKQGAYSDCDIIKNRSWSAARLKSGHIGKNGARRVEAPGQRSNQLSPSLTDSQSLLSALYSPGPGSGQGADSQGRQASSKELWSLRGSQVERLHQEWAAIEHCRAMKRSSEMVQHRLDPMYRISGSNIPLLARYHVNDTEIQRLQEMSETSRILQLDLRRIMRHLCGPGSRDLVQQDPRGASAPCPHLSSSFSGTPNWMSHDPQFLQILKTAGTRAARSSLDLSKERGRGWVWTLLGSNFDSDLSELSERSRTVDAGDDRPGERERPQEADAERQQDAMTEKKTSGTRTKPGKTLQAETRSPRKAGAGRTGKTAAERTMKNSAAKSDREERSPQVDKKPVANKGTNKRASSQAGKRRGDQTEHRKMQASGNAGAVAKEPMIVEKSGHKHSGFAPPRKSAEMLQVASQTSSTEKHHSLGPCRQGKGNTRKSQSDKGRKGTLSEKSGHALKADVRDKPRHRSATEVLKAPLSREKEMKGEAEERGERMKFGLPGSHRNDKKLGRGFEGKRSQSNTWEPSPETESEISTLVEELDTSEDGRFSASDQHAQHQQNTACNSLDQQRTNPQNCPEQKSVQHVKVQLLSLSWGTQQDQKAVKPQVALRERVQQPSNPQVTLRERVQQPSNPQVTLRERVQQPSNPQVTLRERVQQPRDPQATLRERVQQPSAHQKKIQQLTAMQWKAQAIMDLSEKAWQEVMGQETNQESKSQEKEETGEDPTHSGTSLVPQKQTCEQDHAAEKLGTSQQIVSPQINQRLTGEDLALLHLCITAHERAGQENCPQQGSENADEKEQQMLSHSAPQQTTPPERSVPQRTLQMPGETGTTPTRGTDPEKENHHETSGHEEQHGKAETVANAQETDENLKPCVQLNIPGTVQEGTKTERSADSRFMTAYDRWQETKRLMTSTSWTSPRLVQGGTNYAPGTTAAPPGSPVSPLSCQETDGDGPQKQEPAADYPREKIKKEVEEYFRMRAARFGERGAGAKKWTREERVQEMADQKARAESDGKEEEEESGHSDDDYIFSILMSEKFCGGDQEREELWPADASTPYEIFKKEGLLGAYKKGDIDGIDARSLRRSLKVAFDRSYKRFERQRPSTKRFLSGQCIHTVPNNSSNRQAKDSHALTEQGMYIPVMQTFQLEKPGVKSSPPTKATESKRMHRYSAGNDSVIEFDSADGCEWYPSDDSYSAMTDEELRAWVERRKAIQTRRSFFMEKRAASQTGNHMRGGEFTQAKRKSTGLKQPENLREREGSGVRRARSDCSNSSLSPFIGSDTPISDKLKAASMEVIGKCTVFSTCESPRDASCCSEGRTSIEKYCHGTMSQSEERASSEKDCPKTIPQPVNREAFKGGCARAEFLPEDKSGTGKESPETTPQFSERPGNRQPRRRGPDADMGGGPKRPLLFSMPCSIPREKGRLSVMMSGMRAKLSPRVISIPDSGAPSESCQSSAAEGWLSDGQVEGSGQDLERSRCGEVWPEDFTSPGRAHPPAGACRELESGGSYTESSVSESENDSSQSEENDRLRQGRKRGQGDRVVRTVSRARSDGKKPACRKLPARSRVSKVRNEDFSSDCKNTSLGLSSLSVSRKQPKVPSRLGVTSSSRHPLSRPASSLWLQKDRKEKPVPLRSTHHDDKKPQLVVPKRKVSFNVCKTKTSTTLNVDSQAGNSCTGDFSTAVLEGCRISVAEGQGVQNADGKGDNQGVAGLRAALTHTWVQEGGMVDLSSLQNYDGPQPLDHTDLSTRSAGKHSASRSVDEGRLMVITSLHKKRPGEKRPSSPGPEKPQKPLHSARLRKGWLLSKAQDLAHDQKTGFPRDSLAAEAGAPDPGVEGEGKIGEGSSRPTEGEKDSVNTEILSEEKDLGVECVRGGDQTRECQALSATQGDGDHRKAENQRCQCRDNDLKKVRIFVQVPCSDKKSAEFKHGTDDIPSPMMENFVEGRCPSCDVIKEDGETHSHLQPRAQEYPLQNRPQAVRLPQRPLSAFEGKCYVLEQGSQNTVFHNKQFVPTVCRSHPHSSVNSQKLGLMENQGVARKAAVEEEKFRKPSSLDDLPQEAEGQGARFSAPSRAAWGCCPPSWLWDRAKGQDSAAWPVYGQHAAAPSSSELNPLLVQLAGECGFSQSGLGEPVDLAFADDAGGLYTLLAENATHRSSFQRPPSPKEALRKTSTTTVRQQKSHQSRLPSAVATCLTVSRSNMHIVEGDNVKKTVAESDPEDVKKTVIKSDPEGEMKKTVTQSDPEGEMKKTVTESDPEGDVKKTVTESDPEGDIKKTVAESDPEDVKKTVIKSDAEDVKKTVIESDPEECKKTVIKSDPEDVKKTVIKSDPEGDIKKTVTESDPERDIKKTVAKSSPEDVKKTVIESDPEGDVKKTVIESDPEGDIKKTVAESDPEDVKKTVIESDPEDVKKTVIMSDSEDVKKTVIESDSEDVKKTVIESDPEDVKKTVIEPDPEGADNKESKLSEMPEEGQCTAEAMTEVLEESLPRSSVESEGGLQGGAPDPPTHGSSQRVRSDKSPPHVGPDSNLPQHKAKLSPKKSKHAQKKKPFTLSNKDHFKSALTRLISSRQIPSNTLSSKKSQPKSNRAIRQPKSETSPSQTLAIKDKAAAVYAPSEKAVPQDQRRVLGSRRCCSVETVRALEEKSADTGRCVQSPHAKATADELSRKNRKLRSKKTRIGNSEQNVDKPSKRAVRQSPAVPSGDSWVENPRSDAELVSGDHSKAKCLKPKPRTKGNKKPAKFDPMDGDSGNSGGSLMENRERKSSHRLSLKPKRDSPSCKVQNEEPQTVHIHLSISMEKKPRKKKPARKRAKGSKKAETGTEHKLKGKQKKKGNENENQCIEDTPTVVSSKDLRESKTNGGKVKLGTTPRSHREYRELSSKLHQSMCLEGWTTDSPYTRKEAKPSKKKKNKKAKKTKKTPFNSPDSSPRMGQQKSWSQDESGAEAAYYRNYHCSSAAVDTVSRSAARKGRRTQLRPGQVMAVRTLKHLPQGPGREWRCGDQSGNSEQTVDGLSWKGVRIREEPDETERPGDEGTQGSHPPLAAGSPESQKLPLETENSQCNGCMGQERNPVHGSGRCDYSNYCPEFPMERIGLNTSDIFSRWSDVRRVEEEARSIPRSRHRAPQPSPASEGTTRTGYAHPLDGQVLQLNKGTAKHVSTSDQESLDRWSAEDVEVPVMMDMLDKDSWDSLFDMFDTSVQSKGAHEIHAGQTSPDGKCIAARETQLDAARTARDAGKTRNSMLQRLQARGRNPKQNAGICPGRQQSELTSASHIQSDDASEWSRPILAVQAANSSIYMRRDTFSAQGKKKSLAEAEGLYDADHESDEDGKKGDLSKRRFFSPKSGASDKGAYSSSDFIFPNAGRPVKRENGSSADEEPDEGEMHPALDRLKAMRGVFDRMMKLPGGDSSRSKPASEHTTLCPPSRDPKCGKGETTAPLFLDPSKSVWMIVDDNAQSAPQLRAQRKGRLFPNAPPAELPPDDCQPGMKIRFKRKYRDQADVGSGWLLPEMKEQSLPGTSGADNSALSSSSASQRKEFAARQNCTAFRVPRLYADNKAMTRRNADNGPALSNNANYLEAQQLPLTDPEHRTQRQCTPVETTYQQRFNSTSGAQLQNSLEWLAHEAGLVRDGISQLADTSTLTGEEGRAQSLFSGPAPKEFPMTVAEEPKFKRVDGGKSTWQVSGDLWSCVNAARAPQKIAFQDPVRSRFSPARCRRPLSAPTKRDLSTIAIIGKPVIKPTRDPVERVRLWHPGLL